MNTRDSLAKIFIYCRLEHPFLRPRQYSLSAPSSAHRFIDNVDTTCYPHERNVRNCQVSSAIVFSEKRALGKDANTIKMCNVYI